MSNDGDLAMYSSGQLMDELEYRNYDFVCAAEDTDLIQEVISRGILGDCENYDSNYQQPASYATKDMAIRCYELSKMGNNKQYQDAAIALVEYITGRNICF